MGQKRVKARKNVGYLRPRQNSSLFDTLDINIEYKCTYSGGYYGYHILVLTCPTLGNSLCLEWSIMRWSKGQKIDFGQCQANYMFSESAHRAEHIRHLFKGGWPMFQVVIGQNGSKHVKIWGI